MRRTSRFSGLLVGCLLALSACEMDLTFPPLTGSGNWCAGTTGTNCGFPWVAVQPREDSLSVGDTLRLGATYHDATDAVVTAVRFEWVSGDPEVATVDSLGLVHAHAPGWALIQAIAVTDRTSGYAGVWVIE